MAEKEKTVLEKEIQAAERTEKASVPDRTRKTERLEKAGKAEGAREAENKFTKEQLLAAKRFRARQDIVAALLTDGEQYTVSAVEQKISDYMKGKVE